jgi:hypothetical protein
MELQCCPVCNISFRAAEVVPEHKARGFTQFDICPGSFMEPMTLVLVHPEPHNDIPIPEEEDPPSRAQTSSGPPEADRLDDRQRDLETSRQQRLREWLPSSFESDSISLDEFENATAPLETSTITPSVPHSPPRADRRNCREDITCMLEHGHEPPCQPYADHRRPPTISEVICRRTPRCTFVARHKGPCLES